MEYYSIEVKRLVQVIMLPTFENLQRTIGYALTIKALK